MVQCSFCKKNYENPRGLSLVMKNGTIFHLCSSKCRKNMLMKRRKVRWIPNFKSMFKAKKKKK